MPILTIDAKIWVEVAEGTDPEDTAVHMQGGLKQQIEHFPGGEVLKADVKLIYITPEQEIEEEGLGE